MKKLFIFLAFLSLCSCGAKQASEPAPQNTKYVTEQTDDNYKDNYKSECKAVSFDEISKDPDALKGEKVTFTGKVIMIKDDLCAINVTEKDWGYADTVFFNPAIDSKPVFDTIKRGDIVTIWGKSTGFYDYTASVGTEFHEPKIEALFIEIK